MQQLQEIFDRITEHAKKGKRSHNRSHCLYNDGKGNKCFIGCLINDEFYSEKLEVTAGGVRHPFVQMALKLSGWNIAENQLPALVHLQGIHDMFDTNHWQDRLKAFSEEHGLTFAWHTQQKNS